MTINGHDSRSATIVPIAKPAGRDRGSDREPAALPKRGRIDARARYRLGLSLRLYYADLLEQPLPERFTQLLDKLTLAPSDEEDA